MSPWCWRALWPTSMDKASSTAMSEVTTSFLSTTHYIRLGNIGSSRAHDDMATSGFVTKYWMAPEVLRDRFGGVRPAYTAAADIYALGAVLTKLDTLQEPYYDVKDRWSIEENVRTGQLRPHMSDTCPPWLNDLVNQCLAFDPAERPTAVAIVDQLLLHRDAPTEDDHGEALDATSPAESPSTLMDLMASAQRLHAMGLEMCLYTAANNGDLDDVNDLLQRGVDPSCCESFLHRTPLHSASLRGDVAMVARLLAADANVNAIDAKAWSPLHLAAIRGHFDVVTRLLQANADLSLHNQARHLATSGVTAAAVARTRGHLALAKRLDDATTNAAP
ncbi:hypothetical protein SPRG_17344 [Saprolegnia parasitica CBS 223.65]|uniref:Protein kinase domain-containing protein n=1 Tax=Saprolegnia parasitica (strain CBS 223.65) TaxID=695850 RepID=A0A067BRG8_SAPPC|nr:hypothetical protein SPRG_17344 [Saprolegnia parasitica CBS 223.65]KDO17237.1 hypothetical protein SPRG_17344 [Saprolegnia parasitica CBS 223.65]|eukprot:XP_012212056.1 hypothetical protein SPRG_17344 [Saprolegnia parasitica CBS 223.65]